MSAPFAMHPTPKPTLTVDGLRALLDAGGYDSAIIVAHRRQDLPVGCSVALELGDRIARDPGGTTQLPVTCSVMLNGSEQRVGGVTRWRIGKVLPMTVDQERLLLTMDVDLLLGSALSLEDVLLRGGDVLRHLRRLLSDGRATLSSLPIDDRRSEKAAPRLRIDARFAADLAVGRCGLVRQAVAGGGWAAVAPARMTSHQARMAMAACDGLADHILPDLARAARATIGPRGSRAAALPLPSLQVALRTPPRDDDHLPVPSRTLQ
jgi:hypothetical protein